MLSSMVNRTRTERGELGRRLLRGLAFITAIAVAQPPCFAQPKPVLIPAETEAAEFNLEQLDAMLAPIALFPDELLTQTLMASTYPLQVVAAARWLEKDDNKNLKGDVLAKALGKENWDPSVKSLVPFPQVIAMMNDHLEWTQQLGYAMATQEAAVFDSIQRLRRQAQNAGSLKTTKEQRVLVQEDNVVIQPADPQTVYVPAYNPTEVYGEWPYPSSPPVYFPPQPAYYPPGYVFGAGLAFAAGVAVIGGLWGWARPGWNSGTVNINTGRYNNINVNRAQLRSGTWRPPAGGVGGRPIRPPGGPVGAPARPRQLPANAIGRANVRVPGSAVNRPQIPAAGAGLGPGRPGGAQRPGGGQAGRPPGLQRPSAGQLPAGGQRLGGGQGVQRLSAGQLPAGGQRLGAAQRPAGGQRLGAGQLPAGQRPSLGQGRSAYAGQRPAGAFGGINQGARASQYSARGMQSRNAMNRGSGGGFAARGGGGFQARGGGGFAARGGGGRGGGGRGGGRR